VRFYCTRTRRPPPTGVSRLVEAEAIREEHGIGRVFERVLTDEA
jgi:hypothetical protein